MKKNRLFLLISVLLVVAMLFSACGPKPADSTTPDATKAPDATETPAGDPVEEVLEPYTFTFYYNYDWWTMKEWAKDEVSKTLAEKFNVTVEFSKPDADPKAKLNAMVAAKDLPDAIMMDRGPDNINLATLGYLQPLEPYMANNPILGENVLESTQEMLKIDGKLYGIPNWSRKAASGGNDAWIYNDRLYTDAGRPKLETFEDMYNYAMKVKAEQPTNKEGLSVTPVQFTEANADGGYAEARAFYRSYGGNINGWFTVLDGKYQ
ncbi:MAG: hypothetical protein IMZ47_06910, partial [Firmicutes bacterium]|nr:hypothetical protein [Bacillota bacterium]